MVRATLGGAVGKGARGVSKFALVVSAVCSASKKHRARARVRLTFQSQAIPKIQVRQRGAVRESIQSPCGSEQSKYRQRCQGVQVSDGLGHQMQLQSFSGPTTDDVPVRALQKFKLSVSSLVHFASGSNEPGDGGGGRSEISGSVRQCNFC